MAKVHGKQSTILLKGMDISSYSKGVKFSATRKTSDITNSASSAEEHISGLKSASYSSDALYDDAADGVTDIIESTYDSDVDHILEWYPSGDDIGGFGLAVKALSTQYDTSVSITEAVTIAFGGPSNIGLESVRTLHTLSEEAITGVEESYDTGSQHTSGGSAFLHATAVAGTLDVDIEHSADGIAWDTLCSFTQLSANGAERVVFTGTIERYVRASFTLSGGAATFHVAIHLN